MSTYKPDPETVRIIANRILCSEIGAIIDIGHTDIGEQCEEELGELTASLPADEAPAAIDALLTAIYQQIRTNPVIAGQRWQGGEPSVGSTSPTDPEALGAWLRSIPGALLQDRDGHGVKCVTAIGKTEGGVLREYPALRSTRYIGNHDLSEGSEHLVHLARTEAPYVLLSFGIPARAAFAAEEGA